MESSTTPASSSRASTRSACSGSTRAPPARSPIAKIRCQSFGGDRHRTMFRSISNCTYQRVGPTIQPVAPRPRSPTRFQFQTKTAGWLSQCCARAVRCEFAPRPPCSPTRAIPARNSERAVRKLGARLWRVSVSAPTRVWVVDARGHRRGDALPARDPRRAAGRGARRFAATPGVKAPPRHCPQRFAFLRVVPAAEDGHEPRRRDRVMARLRMGAMTTTSRATSTSPPISECRSCNSFQLIKERLANRTPYIKTSRASSALDHF